MLFRRMRTWLRTKAQGTEFEPTLEHYAISVGERALPSSPGSVAIDAVAPSEPSDPIIRSPSNGTLHVDIDIIDKCNLRCPTCFRGTAAQKNTSAVMPVPKFREIVKKVAAEGYPNVTLINWTEPFLCKTLDQYIPTIKEYGMDCWLSSNLSLPPKQYADSMVRTLAAGVDILFVSVSGFAQETYQINHVGGRSDWIKENVEILSRELRAGRIKTSIWIRYLEWPYNAHEKAPWIELCKRLKIGFIAIPAYGDPKTPLPNAAEFGKYLEGKLFATAKIDLTDENIPKKICTLIADRVAIDAKGDAYLCCAFPNEPRLRIGHYTEFSEDELLLRRLEHDFCKTCAIPPRDITDKDIARIKRARERRASQTTL